MPYLLVTTRERLIRQAREAMDTLRRKGLTDQTPLKEAALIDWVAFSQLVEAMHALGVPVDQELKDLAGLRPVDEVLEADE
jgi:hypothetical protein